MMSLRILGLVALFVLTLLVISPAGSWAQNITVTVGSCAPLSGPPPLNFPNPYTCGGVTITPNGAGSANVTAIDGNLDILKFLNARITANQQVTNLHIVATRQFAVGPSTTIGPVFYETTANGMFNTTNTGSVLTVRSTVTDVPSGTTRQMFQQQETDGSVPPNGSSISLPTNAAAPNTQWVPPPHLSGNRLLKIDFWFTLANQRQIQLASIVLKNSANAGGDGEGDNGKNQNSIQQGPAQGKDGDDAERQ